MTDHLHETLAKVEEMLDRTERSLKKSREALGRSRAKLHELDDWLRRAQMIPSRRRP